MPLLWLVLGCANFPRTGDTSTIVLDPDTDTTVPTAQVTWGEEGITLELSETSGYNFIEFGIAQNDTDCTLEEDDEEIPGCWTGEDCVYGDTSADGASTLSMCHTPGTRSTMTLVYTEGGITTALEKPSMPAVDGQYTAFPDDSYEYLVTYYLMDESGACWRWGLDSAYYSGLGCANAY